MTLKILIPKEPEGCKICREAMSVIFKDWTNPELIDVQKLILSEKTCAQLDDPSGCSKGVSAWWEMIAKILWNEGAAYNYCTKMDPGCIIPYLR